MMKREKDDQRETFLCRVYKRDPNGYIIPLDSETFTPFPLVLSKEGRRNKIERVRDSFQKFDFFHQDENTLHSDPGSRVRDESNPWPVRILWRSTPNQSPADETVLFKCINS